MLNLEYKEHRIFSELAEYIGFYKSLSYSVFPFVSYGVNSNCDINSYVLSSIQGTLESIKLILEDGKINDAYALTRKYHDSVIINIYEILHLKDHFSIENFVVEKINNWLRGSEKLPEFKAMKKYIQDSQELENINKLLDLDGHYKKIRKRCNDHTHYNLFHYMMVNDNQVYIKDRMEILNMLSCDIRDIFIKHFIWLFTINGHYMVSSDYMDYVECGMTPEEGSQYWVSPFVQRYLII